MKGETCFGHLSQKKLKKNFHRAWTEAEKTVFLVHEPDHHFGIQRRTYTLGGDSTPMCTEITRRTTRPILEQWRVVAHCRPERAPGTRPASHCQSD